MIYVTCTIPHSEQKIEHTLTRMRSGNILSSSIATLSYAFIYICVHAQTHIFGEPVSGNIFFSGFPNMYGLSITIWGKSFNFLFELQQSVFFLQ